MVAAPEHQPADESECHDASDDGFEKPSPEREKKTLELKKIKLNMVSHSQHRTPLRSNLSLTIQTSRCYITLITPQHLFRLRVTVFLELEKVKVLSA